MVQLLKGNIYVVVMCDFAVILQSENMLLLLWQVS